MTYERLWLIPGFNVSTSRIVRHILKMESPPLIKDFKKLLKSGGYSSRNLFVQKDKKREEERENIL